MGSERREVGDSYVLATGNEGSARLELLDEVYSPATERFCVASGLGAGWRVADVGCGTGRVSSWFAEHVGPTGHVTGIDAGPDQVALAHARAAALGLDNLTFVEGSAYEPGLPHGQFDLVFCRFLLIHLRRPADALAQMLALLRPGGILIAQEPILTTMFTDPPTHAYARFAEVSVEVGTALGVDYDLGNRLFGLFREAGLADLAASVFQPCFSTGDAKRLWEYTYLEAAPGAIAAGLADQVEFDLMTAEFAAIGTDTTTLVIQPCLISVRGRAPMSPAVPGARPGDPALRWRPNQDEEQR